MAQAMALFSTRNPWPVNSSLIDPGNTWAIGSLLIAAATFGIWAEAKTRWGKKISGCLVTMTTAFVLSNTSVLPVLSPVYDMVWGYLVPLAIPLLLFKSNLKRILRETGPPLAVFGLGAVGTTIGVITVSSLIDLGPDTWKVAGLFSATYIGGSLNFVAVSDVLQMHGEGSILTAAVAADNLLMAVYFFFLFLAPTIPFIRRHLPLRSDQSTLLKSREEEVFLKEAPISLTELSLTLTVGFLIAAFGKIIAGMIGFPPSAVLILTAVAVLLATLVPSFMGSLKGSDMMGMFLMQVFFAAVGATAHLATILQKAPLLLLYAGLVITVHALFVFLGAKIFGIFLDDLLIATNANIGGPTTAAAMAAAKDWNHLIIPAILCGTLGYAVATYCGVLIAHLVRILH